MVGKSSSKRQHPETKSLPRSNRSMIYRWLPSWVSLAYLVFKKWTGAVVGRGAASQLLCYGTIHIIFYIHRGVALPLALINVCYGVAYLHNEGTRWCFGEALPLAITNVFYGIAYLHNEGTVFLSVYLYDCAWQQNDGLHWYFCIWLYSCAMISA